MMSDRHWRTTCAAAARISESCARSCVRRQHEADMTELAASRRDLLRFAGALVVTFTIAGPVRVAEEQPSEKSVSPGEVQGFLVFHPTGEVSVFAGKVDLG